MDMMSKQAARADEVGNMIALFRSTDLPRVIQVPPTLDVIGAATSAAMQASTSAASAVGANVVATIVDPSTITVKEDVDVPEHVKAHLKSCATKFEKNAKSFVKVKRLLADLSKDVEYMQEDGGERRCPPKTRPFKSPVELVEHGASMQ